MTSQLATPNEPIQHVGASMQARQLAEVLLAVVAIWYLIEIIPTIPFLFDALATPSARTDDPGAFRSAYLMTSILLRVFVGFALLIWRGHLAARLVPAASVSAESPPWQSAAFAVLGIYFFARGLSASVPVVITGLLAGKTMWSLAAKDLAQAVVGLALFFGAPGLSGAWHGLRSAGSQRSA